MKIVFTLIATFCLCTMSYDKQSSEYTKPSIRTEALLPGEFLFEPQRTYYYDNEEFGVRLVNNSRNPIYIMKPNSTTSSWKLQKLDDGNWKTVNTRIRNTYGTQAVMYLRIEPYGSRYKQFPHENLRDLGKEVAGTYRYTVVLTPGKDIGNSIRVTSEVFRVKSS